MARPKLPAPGETAWADKLNTAINDISDRADAAQEAAIATSAPGTVALDSFPGATDDAKLAAAMSYAAAQAYKPAIMFDNRYYEFRQPITAFSGLRLRGGAPGHVEQVRSGNPIPNQVKLIIGGNAGWLNFPNGNIYGVYVGGLTFYGNSTTRFAGINASSNVVTSVFEDLSFNAMLSVFGSVTTIQAFTISVFRGFWNVNNGSGVQFTLGGSDNAFWEDSRVNLDTPAGFRADNTYMMNMSAMSKSTVGPVYITAERGAALRVEYSNQGNLVFRGTAFEGRNANNPCYGSLIRVDGNTGVMFRDCWYGFGMTDPSKTGRNDAGIIHVTAGDVEVNGATYGRATGVTESVPFIYAEGGKVRVRSVHTQTNQAWTGKPVVVQTGTATVDADNSVTVKDGTGKILQP